MNTSNDRIIQTQLAALPPVDLPEGLWLRVNAARTRRIHQRRAIGLGVGALAALAVLLPAPLPRAPTPASGATPYVDNTPARQPAHARLRSVDQMIQAAYNRGASDAEVAALLSARRTLLGNPAVAPTLPVKI